MKRFHKLLLIFTAVLIAAAFGMQTFAASLPDLTQTGSLTVIIRDKDNNALVNGGKIEIYRVADITDSPIVPEATAPTQTDPTTAPTDGNNDPSKPTDGNNDPSKPTDGNNDPSKPTDGSNDPSKPTDANRDEPSEFSISGGYVSAPAMLAGGGPMRYELTAAFANCGLDLNDLTASAEVLKRDAAALVEYIDFNHVTPTGSKVMSGSGVRFTNAKLGLYLVVQREPGAGHYTFAPFLVTIPLLVNEEWVYAVDASPKGAFAPADPNGSTPTNPPPTVPPTTVNPNKPLPQTGQLWWPVYLLAAAGVLLFAFGWRRSVSQKQK